MKCFLVMSKPPIVAIFFMKPSDTHWLNEVLDVRLGLGEGLQVGPDFLRFLRCCGRFEMSLPKYLTEHLESDVANILCVINLRSFNPLNILSGTSTRAVDKL